MAEAGVALGNSVHEIRPLHCVVRAMGLAPYSLQSNPASREGIIDVKLASNVFGLTASAVVLTATVAGFLYCTPQAEFSLFRNPGDTLCNGISVPLNFIIASIIVIMAVSVNRHRAQELFNKLSHIDGSLCRLRRGCECHRQRSSGQLYLPLMALIVGFMSYDSYVWSEKFDAAFCIAKRCVHIVTLSAIMYYCKLVQMMRTRLSDIHDILSSTSTSNRSPGSGISFVLPFEGPSGSRKNRRVASSIMQVSYVDMLDNPVTLNGVAANLKSLPLTETHTILTLRRVYNDVYECSRILNCMIGLPILLDIFRIFISLTSGLYSLMRLLNEPAAAVSTLPSPQYGISLSTWVLMFLGTITAVTAICGGAASTTKDIDHEIQTLLLESALKTEAVEQLKLFSQQVSHDAIVFTAAGFFPIDLSLLCAVLTSAVTYVVILIQFQWK
jgi:hypothetical protein